MEPVMIEVSGAETLASPNTMPLWFKTIMRREGPFLCAKTYMVVRGNPHVMTTRIDLRPIMRKVVARVKRRGGFRSAGDGDELVGLRIRFNPTRGIKKAVNKIGRNKVIRNIIRKTKPIIKAGKVLIRSPLTKGAISALSYIPVVNIVAAPAAGALEAANVALDAIEDAEKVRNQIKKAARRGSGGAKTLRSAARNRGKISKLMRKSRLARSFIRKMGLAARFSKDPVQRDQALKMSRIFKIAMEARIKAKGAAEKSAGALPGLLIDRHGNLRKGNFRRVLKSAAGTSQGFLYRTKGNQQGTFQSYSTTEIRAAKKRKRLLDRARRLRGLSAKKRTTANSLRELKRSRRNLRSGRTQDKAKSKAALRRARRAGMSKRNRLKLARGLILKMRRNNKRRRKAVSKNRVKVKLNFLQVRRLAMAKARRRKAAPKKRSQTPFMRLMAKARAKAKARRRSKAAPKKRSQTSLMRLMARARGRARVRVSGDDLVGHVGYGHVGHHI